MTPSLYVPHTLLSIYTFKKSKKGSPSGKPFMFCLRNITMLRISHNRTGTLAEGDRILPLVRNGPYDGDGDSVLFRALLARCRRRKDGRVSSGTVRNRNVFMLSSRSRGSTKQ